MIKRVKVNHVVCSYQHATNPYTLLTNLIQLTYTDEADKVCEIMYSTFVDNVISFDEHEIPHAYKNFKSNSISVPIGDFDMNNTTDVIMMTLITDIITKHVDSKHIPAFMIP